MREIFYVISIYCLIGTVVGMILYLIGYDACNYICPTKTHLTLAVYLWPLFPIYLVCLAIKTILDLIRKKLNT